MPEYTVKNVKTFRGMEGIGFNASLYRDGKRVATVDDSAHGGCYDWHWLDFKMPRVKITVKNYKGKLRVRSVTPEEKIFVEHVHTVSDETFEPEDGFVSELVNDYEIAKEYRTKCRTKTLIVLKGYKKGEYSACNAKYTPAFAAKIRETHGEDLVEIINERFVEKVQA